MYGEDKLRSRKNITAISICRIDQYKYCGPGNLKKKKRKTCKVIADLSSCVEKSAGKEYCKIIRLDFLRELAYAFVQIAISYY